MRPDDVQHGLYLGFHVHPRGIHDGGPVRGPQRAVRPGPVAFVPPLLVVVRTTPVASAILLAAALSLFIATVSSGDFPWSLCVGIGVGVFH